MDIITNNPNSIVYEYGDFKFEDLLSNFLDNGSREAYNNWLNGK